MRDYSIVGNDGGGGDDNGMPLPMQVFVTKEMINEAPTHPYLKKKLSVSNVASTASSARQAVATLIYGLSRPSYEYFNNTLANFTNIKKAPTTTTSKRYKDELNTHVASVLFHDAWSGTNPPDLSFPEWGAIDTQATATMISYLDVLLCGNLSDIARQVHGMFNDDKRTHDDQGQIITRLAYVTPYLRIAAIKQVFDLLLYSNKTTINIQQGGGVAKSTGAAPTSSQQPKQSGHAKALAQSHKSMDIFSDTLRWALSSGGNNETLTK